MKTRVSKKDNYLHSLSRHPGLCLPRELGLCPRPPPRPAPCPAHSTCGHAPFLLAAVAITALLARPRGGVEVNILGEEGHVGSAAISRGLQEKRDREIYRRGVKRENIFFPSDRFYISVALLYHLVI